MVHNRQCTHVRRYHRNQQNNITVYEEYHSSLDGSSIIFYTRGIFRVDSPNFVTITVFACSFGGEDSRSTASGLVCFIMAFKYLSLKENARVLIALTPPSWPQNNKFS